jgi:hypothetical protein
MFWFAKLECPVLADRTYSSLNLIFLWTTCHVNHILLVHTHTFVAHFKCIHIGELSWISFKNVQNDISRSNLNSIQYAHILGDQKNAYWIFFESFNQGLSSITKNGKIESASRPLVDFGVLNDNLIKWLISYVKWISRF